MNTRWQMGSRPWRGAGRLVLATVVGVVGLVLLAVLSRCPWGNPDTGAPPVATPGGAGVGPGPWEPLSPSDQQIAEALQALYGARAEALLRGDPSRVETLFDPSSRFGRWAYEHEVRRIQYLKVWAAARGIRLLEVQSQIAVRTIERASGRAWAYLVQTLTVDYVYTRSHGNGAAGGESPNGAARKVNRFRVGTRHMVEVAWQGQRWFIRRDWYTDPLEEDAVVSDAQPAEVPEGLRSPAAPGSRGPSATDLGPTPTRPGHRMAEPGKFDRQGAVAYARRWAGLALGCQGSYNPRYRDYTYLGGDCTNFVSQALADPEGGRLATDSVWHYSWGHSRGAGSGSSTWVQAGSLARYLVYSGRAQLVARGTYEDLVKPTPEHPFGAIARMQEGDVLAYQERGRVEHLAIVTGRDSAGYVLVNTHTADRDLVPWDLGWDKNTIYWLLHIVER
ncbi:MAG: amidase domain-containing protein [Firmicutes bacterium]|nr:amidase domain-containing protein [Bacillota bacterium]